MIRSLFTRAPLARVVRQQIITQQRNFSTPNSRLRVDLVQDLYLREIRSYKAPSLKASDAEGHVQKFSVPKAPRSPDEGDIAQDLKDYENQQVDLEGLADPDGEPHKDYWTEAEAWLEDDDDAPPRC
ncbi:MAG: hypothetical protein LQ345_007433 [Seirophora villosa]|nr:MAG: hypothetical protein LQ345_007433 [Seirophora villosa]